MAVRGGIAEMERKAFLFTNVTGAAGREFDIPVVTGALAGNAAIYCRHGRACRKHRRMLGERHRQSDPTGRNRDPPCQELVFEGDDLKSGNGLDALPVPVSTRDMICAVSDRHRLRHPRSRQWYPKPRHLSRRAQSARPDRVEVVHEPGSGRHRALGKIQGPRGSYADCDGDRLSAAGCLLGRKNYQKTSTNWVSPGASPAPRSASQGADVGSDGAG